ncbi:hypothetical protein IJ182_10875 [bacterium]|nr:hypothetical protein [bacterium]
MFKNFYYNNNHIALVIRSNYSTEGIKFFTKDDNIQQVGYMSHKKGTEIDSHIHNEIQRVIKGTPEVLIIKKGKIRLDLYTREKEYIESTVLNEGDIVLLLDGGHGLKCLEDVEMMEVKQGPYLGVNDKERFPSISDDKVIIND